MTDNFKSIFYIIDLSLIPNIFYVSKTPQLGGQEMAQWNKVLVTYLDILSKMPETQVLEEKTLFIYS